MNELIRDLQEREGLSFEEAQYYLKKAGGDLDRAIYLVYKRKNSGFYKLSEAVKDKITALWQYRLVICRSDRMFINIPFYIFFFLLLALTIMGIELFLPFLILVGLVIVSGSELSVIRPAADRLTMPVSRYRETERQRAAESAERGAFSAETKVSQVSKTDGKESTSEQRIDAAEAGYAEIMIK